MVAIRIECSGGSFLIDKQQWESTHECQLPNGEWLSKRPCDLKWRIHVQPHADYVVYTYRRLFQVAMHRLLLGAELKPSYFELEDEDIDEPLQTGAAQ